MLQPLRASMDGSTAFQKRGSQQELGEEATPQTQSKRRALSSAFAPSEDRSQPLGAQGGQALAAALGRAYEDEGAAEGPDEGADGRPCLDEVRDEEEAEGISPELDAAAEENEDEADEQEKDEAAEGAEDIAFDNADDGPIAESFHGFQTTFDRLAVAAPRQRATARARPCLCSL